MSKLGIRKIFRIIISITLLISITACYNEPEVSKEEPFDREVFTSLGTSGFYNLYDSEVCYIGYNSDGLFFIENKQSDKILLSIRDKISLDSINYGFNGYESRIVNLYKSGEMLGLICVNSGNIGEYNIIDTFSFENKPNYDRLDLYISYYSNPDDCQDLITNIIAELDIKDGEFVHNLYEYLVNFKYDDELAKIINKEYDIYRPNHLNIVDKQSGVCIDTASLGVSILRSKGIPCRMVFGDCNGLYHAWIEYKNGEDWFLMDSVNKNHGLVSNYSSYVNENSF